MSNPNHHNNYSFQDIERYLQGKLSPAEMHALEKAALQDPFLADAIEGYEAAELSTVENDLTEIKGRLQVEDEGTKVVPIRFIKPWWKIAAMIILIAGAGTLGWKLLFDQNEKHIETAQIAPVLKRVQEKNNPTADVIAPGITQDKNIIASNTKKTTPAVQGEKRERIADLDTARHGHEQGFIVSSQINSSALAGHAPDTSKYVPSKSNELLANNALQGKVAGVQVTRRKEKRFDEGNTFGRPSLPAAIDKKSFFNDTSRIALNNAAGTQKELVAQTIWLRDIEQASNNLSVISLKPLTVAGKLSAASISSTAFGGNLTSTGNFTAGVKNDVAFANTVNASALSNTLNEVVVVGYSTKTKRDISGASVVFANDASVYTDSKMIGPPIDKTQDTLVNPTGGWTVFKTELRKKIRVFKKSAFINYGDIEMKLVLDKAGKVTNATILKSFDDTLNTLVIDFVKQYSLWETPVDGRRRKREVIVTVRL
jgi:hypothetical protein